jgi:hypothetical protein
MKFSFSSSQIQTYNQCPWKYYLTYKARIAWPKPVSQLFREFEAETTLGEEFHRAVHRILQGITIPLDDDNENQQLIQWLDNFRTLDPASGAKQVFSEYELSAVVDRSLWAGKFDCIALYEHAIVIFDWKTSSRPLQRKRLLQAAQTRLYPFLMAENLDRFADQDQYDVSAIKMVYWNPNFPESKVSLSYDTAQYQADRIFLNLFAEKLMQQSDHAFPKTDDLKICQYCKFQTRCLRGMLDEPYDASEIDWENLPEMGEDTLTAEDAEFFSK